MRLKFLFAIASLLLFAEVSWSQSLYQQSPGVFLGLTHVDLHAHDGIPSLVLGSNVGYRFGRNVDVALNATYIRNHDHSGNTEPCGCGFTDTDHRAVAFGPVVGYTAWVPQVGAGVRVQAGAQSLLSTFDPFAEQSRVYLASYGAMTDATVFKPVSFGRTVTIYPGVGAFSSVVQHTDAARQRRNFPRHAMNIQENRIMPHFNSGALVQLPVALALFNNRRLVLEPSLRYGYSNLTQTFSTEPGVELRFNF